MVLPYKELIKLAALQFGEKKGQENQKTSLGSIQKAKGTARDSLTSRRKCE